MYIRKIKNSNGKTYVQVIDKSSGKYKVIKSMGGSNQSKQVADLIEQGRQWIKRQTGLLDFDFTNEEQFFEKVFNSIDRLELRGPELLLEKIFDEIGFNKIKDDIFLFSYLLRQVLPEFPHLLATHRP